MKKSATIVCLLFAMSVCAQKRGNIWYFGTNAGLDFNSGTPVALINGSMNTNEGCSSISDNNGNILFYSDGITVYDQTHAVMSNGTGLLGNASSTQSALILPEPNDTNTYFIFTTDAYGGAGGCNYSVVDMTLNGGLGAVTTKNFLLHGLTTEKLAACRQQNGIDYWVITHSLNTADYLVYPLTTTGTGASVISTVGSVHAGPSSYGCMKISQDGTQVGIIVQSSNTIELFDFDRANGTLSNARVINNFNGTAYGLAFSPNGTRLYLSTWDTHELYQFDLTLGSVTAINNSQQTIYTANNPLGTIQLASDNKLYITDNGTSFLGVINDPDQLGFACNYNDAAIDLNGKTVFYGLPNFPIDFFPTGFQYVNTCFGDSTLFSIMNVSALAGAQWDFNDPASGANNISFLFNPAHSFSSPGVYNVQLIQYFLSGAADTSYTQVTIDSIPQINLGPDTTFCTGTTFTLNAGSGYTYLWQDGSVDSVFTAIASGTYWVTVSQNACSATDSVTLNTVGCSAPVVNLMSSDTIFCEKQCIDFFDLSTNNPTSWLWLFPGADSTTSMVQNPVGICYNSYGSFDVTLIACNAAGCDTLTLPGFIQEYQNPSPVVTISNDTLFSSPGYSYQWWNVNTGVIPGATASFFISAPGESYYVIITDSIGCAGSSNIVTITDIHDLYPISQQLQINPNPNNGNFTLFVNSPLHNYTYKIYNSLGQNITTVEITQASQNKMEVRLPGITPGLYTIEIITNNNLYVSRFVKK